MRGKAFFASSKYLSARITPAYAGKSLAQSSAKQVAEDHPRICGEKTMNYQSCQQSGGSPPHMRGKDEKDPVAPCLLLLLYCRFLQFAIDLLDQAAIRQSAMLHLFCQLKMLRQRCQLIVCDP